MPPSQPPPLKGVGFLRACLLAEPPNRVFLSPCERDARAPSTRNAGNAGVPPAIPTAREKTYPFKNLPRGRGRSRDSLPARGEGWGGGYAQISLQRHLLSHPAKCNHFAPVAFGQRAAGEQHDLRFAGNAHKQLQRGAITRGVGVHKRVVQQQGQA
jgi:hypothetical protein